MGVTANWKNFLEQIRSYNSSVNFAANKFDNATATRRRTANAQLVEAQDPVAALKIKGVMTFFVGPLVAAPGAQPKGAQVHLLDPDQQNERRQRNGLRQTVINQLTNVMAECNETISEQFRAIRDYETNNLNDAQVRNAKVYFSRKPIANAHAGQLNAPTTG